MLWEDPKWRVIECIKGRGVVLGGCCVRVIELSKKIPHIAAGDFLSFQSQPRRVGTVTIPPLGVRGLTSHQSPVTSHQSPVTNY